MVLNQPDSHQAPLATSDFFKDLPQDLQTKLAACTSEIERIDLLHNYAWEIRDDFPSKAISIGRYTSLSSERNHYKKGKAKGLLAIAYGYWLLSDSSSIEIGLDCIKLSEEINETITVAKALQVVGNSYLNKGKNYEALSAFKRAISIHQIHEDKVSEANVLNDMANAYEKLGDYRQSLACHYKHLEFHKSISDRRGIIAALANIAMVTFRFGEYSKSLNLYYDALKLSEEINYDRGIGYILNNIGVILRETGQYDESMIHFLKSISIREKLGDKTNLASGFHNVGTVYTEKQDLENAMIFFEKALTIRKDINDTDGIAATLREIGNIHISNKRFLEAENILEKCLNLYSHSGYWLGYIDTQLSKGTLLLNQNRIKESITTFNDALEHAQKTEMKYHQYVANECLSKAYESLGEYYRSLEHYKKYHELKEQVFNEESDRRLKNLQVLHDVEQARLKERQTIRTKLHGDTLSDVTRLHHFGNILKNALAEQPTYHEAATEICDLSVNLDAKLRQLQWGLSETAKTLYEIGKHLEKMGRDILEDTAKFVAVGFTSEMKQIELSPDVADKLSDIFKLAVTNIRKHADASHVTLRFGVTEANILLSITDDGKGFDVTATANIGGIADMKRLAGELAGKLTIISTPTGGTMIDVLMPMPILSEH
jgi:tetratricopeptide (TPR) repeat protein